LTDVRKDCAEAQYQPILFCFLMKIIIRLILQLKVQNEAQQQPVWNNLNISSDDEDFVKPKGNDRVAAVNIWVCYLFSFFGGGADEDGEDESVAEEGATDEELRCRAGDVVVTSHVVMKIVDVVWHC